MSNVFVICWCLCVPGQTDFSLSSDEQMPTTDTRQDMRFLIFYANKTAALKDSPVTMDKRNHRCYSSKKLNFGAA